MSYIITRKYLPHKDQFVWEDALGQVGIGEDPPPGFIADPSCRGLARAIGAPGPGYSSPKESTSVVRMTLPTDSAVRKGIPMFSGLVKYFPAALAEVARVSLISNDKHNPGEPLHHARGKSMDHEDCIIRHTVDAADILAVIQRSANAPVPDVLAEKVIFEKAQRAWRDLADLQQTIEELRGVPLAPGARSPS